MYVYDPNAWVSFPEIFIKFKGLVYKFACRYMQVIRQKTCDYQATFIMNTWHLKTSHKKYVVIEIVCLNTNTTQPNDILFYLHNQDHV